MTCYAVNLHFLVVEENVVAYLQHTNRSVEVSAHEVGKVELVVSRTNEHWTTFSQSSHWLARDIVVGNESAAVGIASKCIVVEFAEHLVHIYRNTKQLLIFLKEIYPCVEVAGTVVTVYHCNE